MKQEGGPIKSRESPFGALNKIVKFRSKVASTYMLEGPFILVHEYFVYYFEVLSIYLFFVMIILASVIFK